MLSEKDIAQIKERSISSSLVEEQISKFKQGFPFLKILKPAVIGDGIIQLSTDNVEKFIEDFEDKLKELTVLKFVPASGAATRMFKSLYAFMEEYTGTEEDNAKLLKDQGPQSLYYFFQHLKDFAFYDDLNNAFEKAYGKSVEEALLKKQYKEILEVLLTEKGLNYGNLPKALLKFHNYEERNRTPIEEHLVEGAQYAKDAKRVVRIHFTVSPEHQDKFKSLISEALPKYEKMLNVKYEISYSIQKPSTDTIAVDVENNPFREKDGKLHFRPAGHGALLENLNDLNADIIFIKNIDNVIPDKLMQTTIDYKKALAGILLNFREKIFNYITKLESAEGNQTSLLNEVTTFLEKELNAIPNKSFGSEKEQKEYLLQKLNRPIRVCGMVKSEGETGGGPFWAQNPDGSVSLQIAETPQINLNDAEQKQIFGQSTHFNPADVVCTTKDIKGNKIDLLKFRDPQTGFITKKSKDGKDLKAMELPGLWNGSMSNWNTLFVEVPLITFNPVKTVNDLLREEHLNQVLHK